VGGGFCFLVNPRGAGSGQVEFQKKSKMRCGVYLFFSCTDVCVCVCVCVCLYVHDCMCGYLRPYVYNRDCVRCTCTGMCVVRVII